MENQVYKWQLSLTNGSCITFDVHKGDALDVEISEWVGRWNKNPKCLYLKIGESQTWIQPHLVGLAIRSPVEKFVPVSDIDKQISAQEDIQELHD